MKYTIDDFNRDFPTEESCFDFLVSQEKHHCPCGKEYKYRLKGTRKLECSCGKIISPFAGTIYANSRTPLKKWLFAIYLFSQARNGVSAAELKKQLGVTEKCAWRMGHQIRKLMREENQVNSGGVRRATKLSGVIEADETYFGRRKGRATRKFNEKTLGKVFGMVERGGKARAVVVQDVTAWTLLPLLEQNTAIGSVLVTDELTSYRGAVFSGLFHHKIKHKNRIYGRKTITGFPVHTNSIEGLWSHLKRCIRGTHVGVSKQHLQKYVDEAVFRYNVRLSSEHPFWFLVRASSKLLPV